MDTIKYTSAGCSGVESMKHNALYYTHCSMLVANTFWARGHENRFLIASDVRVLAVIKA